MIYLNTELLTGAEKIRAFPRFLDRGIILIFVYKLAFLVSFGKVSHYSDYRLYSSYPVFPVYSQDY